MGAVRRLLMVAGGGGRFTPPAQEDGDMAFHGVRAKIYDGTVPLNQAVANNTFGFVKYTYTGPDARCYDTDSFHPILSESNLSGTVAKTAGSAAVVGSGTSFLSQLHVGYPVRIPGGETYYPDIMVVASIADDTHFTAYQTAKFSGSGKTATLDSTAFVIPSGLAGYYAVTISAGWRANGSGIREINVCWNGMDNGDSGLGSNFHMDEQMFTNATTSGEQQETMAVGPVHMAEGEYLQAVVYQSSGGSLNLAADLPGLPLTMWRVGT